MSIVSHLISFVVWQRASGGEKEGRVCSPMRFWPVLGGLEQRQSIPRSSLWYGWGSLCNWSYCQRRIQYGGCEVCACVFVGRVGPKNQVAKGALTQRSLTLSQSGHCEALVLPDLASKQATSCTNNNDLLTGFSLCSCSEMCYSVQHQIF